MSDVKATLEPMTIPTYGLGKPEKNPLFFEKRVYQGSSGKVYPVPFIDKVLQDESPVDTDYAARPGANDLSRYKNIPVPTSYMVCQTQDDFFGGYDFDAQGGFIHVANRHISPGKKQWTWGNHEFGWAWDRELTDNNGPYIELMAGVYTDNQPDFSYLMPYETKTFSQYWWPYQKLGPVQQANGLAAIRCVIGEDRSIDLGLAVSRPTTGAKIVVQNTGKVILEQTVDVAPDAPWQDRSLKFEGDNETALSVWVFNAAGEALVGYRPVDRTTLVCDRKVATEPPMPEEITTSDELYLTGEHLNQYRHPTRYPELYWEAALEKDPLDARSNCALGRLKLSRADFAGAAPHFENAIARLTFRHPNPETGEAHYYLGLTQRYLGAFDTAYDYLYKSTWNYAWRSAAYYELAAIEMRRGKLDTALQHLDESLKTNADHNKACVCRAICLRKMDDVEAAALVIDRLLEADPLDHWALAEKEKLTSGQAKLAAESRNDAQTALDIAFDYAECGCLSEAIELLQAHHATEVIPVQVPNPMERSLMTRYTLAWLYAERGDTDRSEAELKLARESAPDYCFPSRLQEIIVLQWAQSQSGADRNAGYGMGNFFYDKRRPESAISAWEQAREADAAFSTVHRNLGIAYWNVRRDTAASRACYEKALECEPDSSRLLIEYVQLCRKLGDPAETLLAFLEARMEIVLERDDATVELAALYNETGQPQQALDLVLSRSFHPWEGGEGKVLRQYTSARLQLGQAALGAGDPAAALEHFELAMQTPERLGEKYHLLQAKADVLYWQACALRALDREPEAVTRFEAAANESGDFQSMAVSQFSELTYFKAKALAALGRQSEAEEVLSAMAAYAKAEMQQPAKIDYFATSLPNLLVFEEDIDQAKQEAMQRLLDLAESGLD